MRAGRRTSTRRGGVPARPRRAAARRLGRRSADRDTRRAALLPGAGALDGGIAASVALLAAFGVVMIFSATAPLALESPVSPQFVRHLTALGLSVVIGTVALRVPIELWRRVALPLWAVSVLLLVATLAAGIEVNGSRRWIALPFVRLQPAELAKWATAVAAASVLASARPGSPRAMNAVLLLAAPPAALLLLQPDLGSAGVLVGLAGVLLFVSGTSLRRMGTLAGLGVAGLVVYVAVRPYALARWKGFLAPWRTSQAEGFQLVQSFVAFGRGGTTGVGLGDGRQKLAYLPEAHTDFILSVVAEELGLVGVLVVLGAFAALGVAGLRVARRARDPFARLMAVAMTAFLALPAAVNAAVVMGLVPTTGFTLPFISYGSNSLVVCALAVGVLLRISAAEAGAAGAKPRARAQS